MEPMTGLRFYILRKWRNGSVIQFVSPTGNNNKPSLNRPQSSDTNWRGLDVASSALKHLGSWTPVQELAYERQPADASHKKWKRNKPGTWSARPCWCQKIWFPVTRILSLKLKLALKLMRKISLKILFLRQSSSPCKSCKPGPDCPQNNQDGILVHKQTKI